MDKNTSPQFATIFGAQADKDTITTIPNAPSHGRASLQKGFPIETMTPLAAGGVPPNGADMNGILNMLSIAAKNAEAGLIRAWNSDYSKEIGGYPYGALTLSNGHLYVSQADNNGDAPPSDGSNAPNWKNILSDAFTNASGAYLPLSGGTMTGNITFAAMGDTGGEWETAPHTVFLLPGVNGSCQMYAQIDANKNPQMVIGVPNDYNGPKFWLFKANGKLISPAGLTLLEAESDGNGRVKIHDLDGVKDGQVVANWEDIKNIQEALPNYLPVAGGTVTGNITFAAMGDTGGEWETAPHTVFLLPGVDGSCQLYAQIDGNKNPQMVIGVPNDYNGPKFWSFKANGKLISPAGLTMLEAQNDGYGRVRIHDLEGVKDGQVLANWEDLANLVNGTSSTPTDSQVTNIYYRPSDGHDGLNYITCEYKNNDGSKDYISLRSHEWVEDNYLPLAGGTMTGDITMIQNGAKWAPWYTSPAINLPMPGFYRDSSIYGQLDGSGNPQTVISVTIGTGAFAYFSFKSNGSLQLTDNTLALSANDSRRMIMQKLTISQAYDGTYVKFPRAFADNNFHISIDVDSNSVFEDTSHNGDYRGSPKNQLEAGSVKTNNKDPWGFWLSMRFMDNTGSNYSYGGNISVIAFGYA